MSPAPADQRESWAEHRRRVDALAGALADSTGPVRLRKGTSNLFRAREDAGRAEVEGMTTYADLVDAALPHGLAPAIVPELKSITVGGAVSGVGIESGGFRYGLVHDTVEELDVLVADGRVLTCSPEQYPELFHGFPNSYGSLGYATRVRIGLIPVKPFVRL